MRRAWACLALPLVLAACEHQQGGASQASLTLQPPPPGQEEAEPTAAERAAVPSDLASSPVRLSGLSYRVVRAALGPPNFRRREIKGVETWQYYGEGCILHVFIYDEDGKRTVKHQELRGQNGEPPAGCFRGIVDSRRKPLAS